MMKSPKNCQSESGMWNLLVDKTDCWLEASGSAMFAYAMIMEVKKGWLDAAEYGLVVWKLFRKEVCFWGVRDRPLFYGHS
jgi:unsaturated rhamnogalacturonyl hydrolase